MRRRNHLIKVKPVSLIWHVIRELPPAALVARWFVGISDWVVRGKKELCVVGMTGRNILYPV